MIDPRQLARWRMQTELAHWRYQLRKLIPEVEQCRQNFATTLLEKSDSATNGQVTPGKNLEELAYSYALGRYLMEEAKYRCELFELLLSG